MVLLATLPLVLGLEPGLLVAIALASIVFLCTVLIVAALMLRNKWNDIGNSRPRRPQP